MVGTPVARPREGSFSWCLLAAHGHTFHQLRMLSVSVRRDATRDRGVLLRPGLSRIVFKSSADATPFNAIYRRLSVIEGPGRKIQRECGRNYFAIGSLDVFINNAGNSSMPSAITSV